jgi:hypothetical protein
MAPLTRRLMVARVLVWLLILGLLAAPADAGQPGQRKPQQPGRPTRNMSAAQLHQLFDTMLVMQAQKALSLDEQQYGNFVARVRTLQDTRRRNQQERARLLGDLQRMTNPRAEKPASEDDLKARLNALQEHDARAAAELRKAYNGIDEVLTPFQQARFRVLEEQIERRKLELLGRARQRNPNRSDDQRPRRPPGR